MEEKRIAFTLDRGNLNRKKRYPSLTRNEIRFKRAIENNQITNHYHHLWVDDDGEQHWDCILD